MLEVLKILKCVLLWTIEFSIIYSLFYLFLPHNYALAGLTIVEVLLFIFAGRWKLLMK